MNFDSSIGDPTIFWAFRVLLVLLLAYGGYKMSRGDDKQAKNYFWFVVISFALIEGLRWMRGPDYYNYYCYFESGKADVNDDIKEPLFRLWIYLVNFFHVYPPIAFVVHSGLLIASFTLMLKYYKEAAVVALPLLFIYIGGSAENIVRQYTATSFLMLAYYFYANSDNKKMYACMFISCLFHFSALFPILLFFLFQWKKIPYKMPLIFVAAYLIIFTIWDTAWLEGFSTYIQGLNIAFGDSASSFQKYVDESDFWMNSSFSELQGTKYSGTRYVFNAIKLIANSSLIYFGFKACKDDEKLHVVFYLFFLSLILKEMVGDAMILVRFVLWINWMLPFVAGLVFCRDGIFKNNLIKYGAAACVFLHYVYYGFIYYIGSVPLTGCGFIWDA